MTDKILAHGSEEELPVLGYHIQNERETSLDSYGEGEMMSEGSDSGNVPLQPPCG